MKTSPTVEDTDLEKRDRSQEYECSTCRGETGAAENLPSSSFTLQMSVINAKQYATVLFW